LSFASLFLNFNGKRTFEVLGQTVFVPLVIHNKQQQTTSEEQMKFNKWTLGLAAVGVVSLTSAVRADEAKLSPLNTALSNTTISGYVDVAGVYTPGNVSEDSGVPGTAGRNDGFQNIVDIALDKPEDESPWASGYHVEFNLGDSPIDSGYGAIRQAYVVVRTPLGNGIDWKFGIEDNVIGYEGNTGASNPNFTHSYGYELEPTTLVGLIGTYKVIDALTVQAGVAENYTGGSETFDSKPFGAFNHSADEVSSKTLVATIALTAPDSWGFLKGATLNAGALINPYAGGADNYYAGVVIPTPISALKFGGAFDLVSRANSDALGNSKDDSVWDVALYANYQATDKLSLNFRGEYADFDGTKGEELTGTVQYNLWANVISRAEVRWDHADTGGLGETIENNANNYTLAVNLIYQF
jgi:Putative beta-barrel porin-2, OmpL-like. bbp2